MGFVVVFPSCTNSVILVRLEAVDPGSFTFRYPVDTIGRPSIFHHFMLHIPTFCQRMNALPDALEDAMMGLEIKWNQILEAAYHAGSNEYKYMNDLEGTYG